MAYRNYGPNAGYVVAKDGTGDFLTIGSALTAASSLGGSGTLYLKAGTYTENPALIVGWNLVAWDADALTPNVIINGKCTYSGSGSVSISGISLQTNSDFFLSVTGANPSIVNLTNCYLNCLNNTGINYTSSSGSAAINCYFCVGDIGTTGIGMFTQNSNGNITFYKCHITNSGSSTTATTSILGAMLFYHCEIFFAISTSASGGVTGWWTRFDCSVINTTAITAAGSGSTLFYFCRFAGGTASAISCGGTVPVYGAVVNSSNTNAITGAGTLQYGGILFDGSSSTINTSVQTPFPWPVKQGGTGQSTLTNHGVLVGAGTSAITQLAAGSAGQALLSGGASADPAYSTPTYPSASGSTGVILRSDGTNNVYTTATYPATTGANTFLTSVSANTVATGTYIAKTTFTPVLAFGGASVGITYSSQSGNYQQIGNVVFFNILIQLTSKGSSTGNATITGMPVTASGYYYMPFVSLTVTIDALNEGPYYLLNTGGTVLNLYENALAGGQTTLKDTNFANNSQLYITGIYFA